ncbi:hypothetical protein AA0229_1148 [Gluconobacter cerinus NRIC 0229]|nr:hypothetical protein AA0229_1148 [Gluconobacter cerinus NRIC 0229]
MLHGAEERVWIEPQGMTPGDCCRSEIHELSLLSINIGRWRMLAHKTASRPICLDGTQPFQFRVSALHSVEINPKMN